MSGHQHSHDHQSEDNLRVAFFLNFGFTLLEIAGGIFTNSIAILTDAVHDMGDSISLGLAWYFERVSHREHTPFYTYGYRRFRLLGGLITGITLLGGLGFVLYHAIGRLAAPEEVHVPGMLGLAVLGILFNGAAVLRMKTGKSLTEKLVSWHLMEDMLGWVAVLVGASIIGIWNLKIIDPILSIGISLFVLSHVGRNLMRVTDVILQKAPSDFDVADFEKKVCAMEEIESVHHVHCWSIDGESHVLSVHLVLHDSVDDPASVKAKVRALLDQEHFEHITLETETPAEAARELQSGTSQVQQRSD